MFAKIVEGKDLQALESEVNKYLNDVEYKPGSDNDKRKLKVHNVQQFVIGEVDPATVSLINRQPVPQYSFCLLLICGYE